MYEKRSLAISPNGLPSRLRRSNELGIARVRGVSSGRSPETVLRVKLNCIYRLLGEFGFTDPYGRSNRRISLMKLRSAWRISCGLARLPFLGNYL